MAARWRQELILPLGRARRIVWSLCAFALSGRPCFQFFCDGGREPCVQRAVFVVQLLDHEPGVTMDLR